MILFNIISLIFVHIPICFSFTHWVVTDYGRVVPKLFSQYHLRQPYDLYAILQQENRQSNLDKIIAELQELKLRIESKTASEMLDTNVAQVKKNCVTLMKLDLLSEFQVLPINGSSKAENKLWSGKFKLTKDLTEPHCTDYFKLPYSLISYDHIPTILNRKDLQINPLPNMHQYLANMNNLGEKIAYELLINSTSWLHYNLAMLYWWSKGDGFESIECARRALFFVPLSQKFIPLINLGSMFQMAKQWEDAVILLEAGLDHIPEKDKANFTHIQTFLKKYKQLLDSDYSDNDMSEHVTHCLMVLQNGLFEYHNFLQEVLADYHKFHNLQQQWLSLHDRLVWEIEPQIILSFPNIAKKTIEGLPIVKEQMPFQLKPEYLTVISKSSDDASMLFDSLLKIKEYLKQPMDLLESNNFIEGFDNPVLNENDDKPSETETEAEIVPTLSQKYPTSMNLPKNLFFDQLNWPTKENCEAWNLPYSEQENLQLPIFMPPENKGYDVHSMLSDRISVNANEEHPLPWYPPVCEHSNAAGFQKFLNSLKPLDLEGTPLATHKYFISQFLKYTNNGNTDISEIGQRIITALNKKVTPSWIMAVMASVYWRIRNNPRNALMCLDIPLGTAIANEDVILTSVGSILQQLGSLDNALKFANLAFKVNYLEPSTNFLLALIHYQKDNPILAMYYLKSVLRVDPDYYGGEAERLLKLWACRIKTGNYHDSTISAVKNEDDLASPRIILSSTSDNNVVKTAGGTTVNMCLREESSFSSEGVICSPNGDQCKTAAIQCFKADRGGSSVCSRNKKSSTNHEGSGSVEPDQSQLESFDEFNPPSSITIGDFYVSASNFAVQAHDKTGTYTISREICNVIRDDLKDSDSRRSASLRKFLTLRNVNVKSHLQPLLKPVPNIKPHCTYSGSLTPAKLNAISLALLKNELDYAPETDLNDWIRFLTDNQDYNFNELGAQIALALKQNKSSWELSLGAFLFWQIAGKVREAVACLRQAIANTPKDMRDIPIINMANILYKVGFYAEAFEVVQLPLESHPGYAFNHFSAGNIYVALDQKEKAMNSFRTTLSIDAKFEAARSRLIVLLCQVLLDENGNLKKVINVL